MPHVPNPVTDFDIARAWWQELGGPFTPGKASGNNDGCVRDGQGRVIADCGGCEAYADVLAALLNDAESRGISKP